ncbi:MAG: DUF192 domain-containing protein [Acidimicrobiales bacterium]
MEGDEGGDAGSGGPNPAVVLGVALMLIGLLMVAVSVFGPDDKARVEASQTTMAPATRMSVPPIGSATTAPTTPAGIGVGVAPEVGGRTPLRGFGEVQVTIVSGDGKVCHECLLAAFNSAQRQRGLMEVEDPTLGGYGGMLFEFPTEVRGSFWMRRTPQPLSIAYFDDDGRLVSVADMEPCDDSASCPTYPAKGDFAYAIEVPKGKLEEMGIKGDARLTIDARQCEAAKAGG